MTRQQKIREGLHNALQGDNPTVVGEPCPYCRDTEIALNYLDSVGAVLKVKCPDCEWSQFIDEAVGMTPCPSCNSTGYKIEPLIAEEEIGD